MKKELLYVSLGLCVSLAALNAIADESSASGSIKQTAPAQADAVADVPAQVATDEDLQNLPNVGNKFCPVSGEEIKADSAMGEGVHMAYQGKIYNLCCPMCVKDFKKDPQKYIAIINEELAKDAPAADAQETTK